MKTKLWAVAYKRNGGYTPIEDIVLKQCPKDYNFAIPCCNLENDPLELGRVNCANCWQREVEVTKDAAYAKHLYE